MALLDNKRLLADDAQIFGRLKLLILSSRFYVKVEEHLPTSFFAYA